MQKDLRDLLRDPNLLPSERQNLLTRIAVQAAAMNMPCYIVGGFVRDLLLGRPLTDLDIVVEGEAIKLGNELVKKHGGKLIVHHKFHTCRWHLPDSVDPSTSLRTSLAPEVLDIITARSETYEFAGALPTVKPSTIQDDIRRRDFTINAISVRLDGDRFGDLLDPLNGQGDLEAGLLRVLHPRSFIDDPTRILRAIRYEQRYGFKIEPATLKLIDRDALAVLSKVSGERIRNEFDLFIAEDNSASMLSRAEESGVFRVFRPELPKLNGKYAGLMNSEPSAELGIVADRVLLGYLLWLMDSTAEIVRQISGRLDFTSKLLEAALAVIQLKAELNSLEGSKPSAWTIRLDQVPAMSIYALWLATSEAALKEYLSKWRHVKANITGDDLKARGLPPGPRYGEILARLQAAWLDGEVNNHEEAMALLSKLS